MKYKGKTPVKPGESVYLTAYEKESVVHEVLASQFTTFVNNSKRFFFYEDRGDTWKKTSEM